MTIRNSKNHNYEIGRVLLNHRLQLTEIPNVRSKFIEDRDKKIFNWEFSDENGDKSWISEKTLMNYELGKNIPSLKYLKRLAIAYEVDILDLIQEILPYL